MHWKEKLLSGVGGGICLAFVRLIRDATANDVSLDALGSACLTAIPLCAVATFVVFIYKPKNLRESFTTALLAPSMLISIIADSKSDDAAKAAAGEGSDLGAVHSTYEAPFWAESLSLFTVSTVYAQPLDSIDTATVRPRSITPTKIRQIKPEQFRTGVWSRTLRFLGMSQESTDWVYVLHQTPDSASAESLLRTLIDRVDTAKLALQIVHPAGKTSYYLVAGDFGSKSQAFSKQQLVEAALARGAETGSDSTAVELLKLLKGAGLKTGRVMSAK